MVRTKIIEVEQGSDRWQALRRGRVTASHMGDVMAQKSTKRYQDYRQLIVMELLGFEEPEESARWFDHGKAMEPYARGAYEWKYDCQLTADVFCIHPEYDWLACSPDGLRLPDFDRPVEIKCREKFTTYRAKVADSIRLGRIDPTYRAQVQAQIWIMGVPSLDYVEYYHDDQQRVRKMHVTTVPRDDAYIEGMEQRCMEFMIECYQLAEKDPARLAA